MNYGLLIVLLPVALAPKTGLDAYQPLATAVCGGLVIGTILSLLDIPIMHTYVDDFIRWLNKTFLNRDWQWPTREPEEDSEVRVHDAAHVGGDATSPERAPSNPTVRME